MTRRLAALPSLENLQSACLLVQGLVGNPNNSHPLVQMGEPHRLGMVHGSTGGSDRIHEVFWWRGV